MVDVIMDADVARRTEVRFFESADAAMEAVRSGTWPDAVVSDEGLPGTSGSAMLQAWRKADWLGKFLLCSGGYSQLDGVRLLELQADFMLKNNPVAVARWVNAKAKEHLR
ncbi:hypothetical protein A2304_02205 [Candidatus Uhrbacteria bacterium RIFOXYB2_FULL_57_15]|uniref:Response regulatory domain-containing protein n=1 Tax=Candidatus Uhrbacteria bacterium RIFOXYB2_FULL_57_15 TaxID=1802422 RepID=A0A1F7W6S1_9BACT|nr:MAG: hypothetical protein A2304_02205 [Candidatus Uhrbacteria bacterium RIFOXYB2_FULL_57_15]OGL99203.1 MAG: hypothetical protein A2501_03330 [Candidatus Uhrbacteria bacterium RIFOXYC12_FULL_57_11]